MAFPRHRSTIITTLAKNGDDLAIAQQAWSQRDTATMRRALARLSEARQALPPEYLKFETLLPESELLLDAGDVQGALVRVAPTLDAQHAAELDTRTPIGAALFVRAMALRAVLESQQRDPASARRWARAFIALWRDAEPILREQVRRVSPLVG